MKSKKALDRILILAGLRLAQLRIDKGHPTIKEFAQTYELPEIQYWRIEKGRANITLKTLIRILAIHNLSIHDFFCMVAEEERAA
jgi:hypothetical protein